MIFKDARIFLGGYNLSGDHNQVGLDYQAESVDDTRFGATARTKIGGLKVAVATGKGYFTAGPGTVDEALFLGACSGVGADDAVLTMFPDGITEGSTSSGFGYAFKVTQSSYRLGGAIGVNLPFEFLAEGRGILA